jgi:YD repeat-containing protein
MQRERGVVFSSLVMAVVVSPASDCHRNSARLWWDGSAVAVGTGYALSDDELWREHSWAWDDAGRLLETTSSRIRYFSVRFDGEDGRWFADWVAPKRTTRRGASRRGSQGIEHLSCSRICSRTALNPRDLGFTWRIGELVKPNGHGLKRHTTDQSETAGQR